MICKKCGAKISDEDLFCKGCGTSFEELKNGELIIKEKNNLDNNNKKQKCSFIDKLRKINKIPLICGGVILLLLVSFILYYFLVLNSSKSIFKTVTNKLYSELNDEFKENKNYNSLSGNYSISINTELTDESLNFISDIFNKINMNMNYELDYKNKIANIDYDIKYDNSQFLKSSINISDDNYYLYLNGLYDKYIKIDSNELKGLFWESNNSYEDISIILKEVKNAFNDSLKNNYFKKSTETIKVNGKDAKVKKVTLILNEKNVSEIKNSMIKQLKNNKEFIKSLSKLLNDSESNIKSNLNVILEEKLEFEDIYELSLYTKGLKNELVGADIKGNDFALEITKDTEEKLSLRITINDVILTGNIEINGDDEKSNIKLSLSFIGNKIEFDISNTIKYNTDVKEKEIKNSVDYNSLTEENLNKISENFEKQEGFIKFSKDLTDIYETSEY